MVLLWCWCTGELLARPGSGPTKKPSTQPSYKFMRQKRARGEKKTGWCFKTCAPHTVRVIHRPAAPDSTRAHHTNAVVRRAAERVDDLPPVYSNYQRGSKLKYSRELGRKLWPPVTSVLLPHGAQQQRCSKQLYAHVLKYLQTWHERAKGSQTRAMGVVLVLPMAYPRSALAHGRRAECFFFEVANRGSRGVFGPECGVIADGRRKPRHQRAQSTLSKTTAAVNSTRGKHTPGITQKSAAAVGCSYHGDRLSEKGLFGAFDDGGGA